MEGRTKRLRLSFHPTRSEKKKTTIEKDDREKATARYYVVIIVVVGSVCRQVAFIIYLTSSRERGERGH